MIANDMTELVGNTPMVWLNKITQDCYGKIAAKLEFFNPGGSIKDRIGLNMILDAEKSGRLKKGMTIVEPTSGNTGIALAWVAAVRGYKLILTMPESMTIERRKLVSLLGAEIVLTAAEEGMNGSVKKAVEIASNDENVFILQQFRNPANPQIHRETTAEEIWRDTDGKVDIFVAGIGTGGTFTGVCEVLKSRRPSLVAVAVEPEDSAVLSGSKSGHHMIQGIGAGFIPEILNTKAIDEIVTVSSKQSFEMAKRLAREEGIMAGISSGAAVAAAVKMAKRKENKDKVIVVILPDTAERYISTILFD